MKSDLCKFFEARRHITAGRLIAATALLGFTTGPLLPGEPRIIRSFLKVLWLVVESRADKQAQTLQQELKMASRESLNVLVSQKTERKLVPPASALRYVMQEAEEELEEVDLPDTP